LISAATDRLPEEMDGPTKERWAEEMSADVLAKERFWRRWYYAIGIWRKGAPKMPVRERGFSRP
jgi:hypothetical protein